MSQSSELAATMIGIIIGCLIPTTFVTGGFGIIMCLHVTKQKGQCSSMSNARFV